MTERHPDEIHKDLADAADGIGEMSVMGAVWELIADIQNSYDLAIADALDDVGFDPDQTAALAERIRQTVTDYIANHYGDD